MSEKPGNRFDPDQLRLMWKRGERSPPSVSALPAQAESKLSVRDEGPAAADLARKLEPSPLRSHIPYRRPEEVMKELEAALRSRLGTQRMSVVNLWKSLCELVSKTSGAPQVGKLSGAGRTSDIALQIDRLDDALAGILSNRGAGGGT